MKRNIFLYLFLFASLWIVYQYVHNKRFYESQQQKMTKLETKHQKAVDSIDVLLQRLGETEYFGLRSNANAYEYYEDSLQGISTIIQQVTDGIIGKNTIEGNMFIPYEGDERAYQVNQIHLLNLVH